MGEKFSIERKKMAQQVNARYGNTELSRSGFQMCIVSDPPTSRDTSQSGNLWHYHKLGTLPSTRDLPPLQEIFKQSLISLESVQFESGASHKSCRYCRAALMCVASRMWKKICGRAFTLDHRPVQTRRYIDNVNNKRCMQSLHRCRNAKLINLVLMEKEYGNNTTCACMRQNNAPAIRLRSQRACI